ncbi:conserved hypothetical protein [Ixodes scapularis]|uniref:FAD synthase n=1 Tax=Ixodes scapularis TaxID=6945 RepID=B7QJL4_IXOSC|nr:conserved hypothetical protein [Ixodes scapularis]|eukprot:XP_002415371.1 conserved hypothetical protein [Ixodes scapularis]
MSSGGNTAGIIVIGDEILRGDIADTNVFHICSRLRALGIRVERVSIIPDIVPVIAEEVKKFSDTYRYVFTSGGVGPTHDDVTYESVARAFGEELFVHPGVLELCLSFYGPKAVDNGASAKIYDCDLQTLSCMCYKDAVREYLRLKPNVKAFLLGNRSTDPGGDKLKPFIPTDQGWPPAMRVFPVLDWEYKDVWNFIRDLSIPYCALYDQGYSSIGENEAPNEVLIYWDSRGARRFKPAYMLEDSKLERSGRK